MIKLNAKQLRSFNRRSSFAKQINEKRLTKNEIYIVLDNVLDTYNIGSIFRLADAVAAKKVYLCGGTETPPNSRIKKASINTTEVVEWEYCPTAVEAIKKVKKLLASRSKNKYRSNEVRTNLQIVAVEQSKKSVPYDKFYYKLPVCLIVGNETTGVSKEVLDLADGIVELPMFGVNKSLNVVVSLGTVLYKVIGKTIPE